MTSEFKQSRFDWGFMLQWLFSMAMLWWLIEWGLTNLKRSENKDIWTPADRTEYYKIRSLCVLALTAIGLTVLGLVLWALFLPRLWLMATIAGVVYAVVTGVYHLDAALSYKRDTAPSAPATTT